MKKFSLVIFFALISFVFYGCAQRTSKHIAPSFAGIRSLEHISQSAHKIKLLPFTSSIKKEKLPCRSPHDIKPAIFSSFEGSLENAIKEDLKQGRLYSYWSKSYLTGNLNQLTFNAGDFGQAHWIVSVTFSGKTLSGKMIKPFTVSETYYFYTHTTDEHYCRMVAENFSSLIRAFIVKLYDDPNFIRLITT